MPQISVIIPVYNTQRYLRQCLDSVVNQTLRDIEIICVDDGSTDASPEILREYQARDERITILTQEKSNAGAARNLGLSIATGEYLSFLDSDDFFELTMLEHMLACAKSRIADIVVCEMKLYYEDSGEAVPVSWHIRKDLLPAKPVFAFSDIRSNAFRCIVAYVWDKLIKRDFVLENQLQFQSQFAFNDAVFVYAAMMSAETITVLEEYLVYNRKRAVKTSITDYHYQHFDCVYSVLAGLKDFLIRKGVYERCKRDFICYAVHLMDYTYSANKEDNVAKNDMRDKIGNWLEVFDITGHEPFYYYELSLYQTLLQKIKTQSTDAELARLQQELDRLNRSLSYRFVCYFRVNGLRSTLRRIAERITGK